MTAISKSKDLRDDVRILKRLESEIEAGRIRVYRSLFDSPYISCGSEPENERPSLPAIQACLFDKAFRSWLTLFAWKREEILLTQRGIERVLGALDGWSMLEKAATIAAPELLRIIESEPVVAILLEFMYSKEKPQGDRPRYETTMERLWRDLRDFASDRGLLTLSKNRYPGGANVLSRKLRQLEPVLAKLGIKLTTQRSDGCKVVIERLGDRDDQPSNKSSESKLIESNNLRSEDGGRAAILSALEAKQRRDRPPEPSGDQHR